MFPTLASDLAATARYTERPNNVPARTGEEEASRLFLRRGTLFSVADGVVVTTPIFVHPGCAAEEALPKSTPKDSTVPPPCAKFPRAQRAETTMTPKRKKRDFLFIDIKLLHNLTNQALQIKNAGKGDSSCHALSSLLSGYLVKKLNVPIFCAAAASMRPGRPAPETP